MGRWRGVRRLWWVPLCVFAGLGTAGCRCAPEGEESERNPGNRITVLRVESLSPESPGAEHCNADGKNCSPLAPQQKLPPEGLVRTFAGGKVSLDFGGGRRVDLDPMSETHLSADKLHLEKGQFALESTPLAEQEKLPPLHLVAAGKNLSPAVNQATAATLSVRNDDTILTVRRGQIGGIAFPGLGEGSPQAGQSVRISGAQVYRTGSGGQELPALPYLAPRASEFHDLLTTPDAPQPRGLGTMTARLPNTDQVRDGVVLKKHHVRVVVRDGYARTEIEEEFENTTPHVLEGRYRFPVPADASLSRLALWVGDELMEGEVLERERAASIYSKIVDRPVPRDPALLEWVTGGEMSLKVFPIVPQKTRRVLLAYNQALSTENGLLRYVYPLSLGQGRETKIDELSITVHLSDAEAALSNVRAPNYDAKIGKEGDWTTVSLVLEGATPSKDFVLLADRSISQNAQISAHVASWGKAESKFYRDELVPREPMQGVRGHFALRLSADMPESTPRPRPLPQDRALVLDVSQSQSKATIRAQAALAYGVLREMNADEHYVLLACDSACEAYPATGPAAATTTSVSDAAVFLTQLSQGGSSDVAGSLVAAAAQLRKLPAQGRERQIVWMGDGRATSGDLSAETIATRAESELQKAQADVRLIGAGRTLEEDTLKGLARALDATYDTLQSGTSLEERIFELAISLRRPVIRGARLILPTSLRVSDSARLPALRLGQELRVTGEILELSGGDVTLEGTLGGAPYRISRAIAWSGGPEAQNPLVPRLWARDRISKLQSAEVSAATREEIISLSKAHRTMSKYTSFLVLENEKMYRDFGVTRTSRTEDDQPDAAFSEVDHFTPGTAPTSAVDSKQIQSLEDLGSSAEEIGDVSHVASKGDGASAAAPRMRAPVAPRPSPAPAPKASKPSLSEFDEDGLGSLGSASAKESSGSGRASGSVPPPWDTPKRRFRPPHQPRRAHLSFSQADDAWRKWGEESLVKLSESLKQDEGSRARHEAYIRGHLKLGRFREAREDATRLTEMDPDYAPARRLLAYAAVVDGDHELSRRMLDVASEADPDDPAAHAESARAFEVAGDVVRACAHYRALAELAPQLEEATTRARSCWDEVLGSSPPASTQTDEGKPGQLQIDVKCDAGTAPQDCPSPVVVAPDGSILSPWTPGTGRSSRTRVTFVKLRSGDYYVLVLGGAPHAKGTVVLTGRHENQAFKFEGGGMHTIAKASVSFW